MEEFFLITSTVIQSIQIATLVPSSWSSSLSKLRFDFTDEVYMGFFWSSVISVLGFSFICVLLNHIDKGSPIIDFIWIYFGSSILFGLLGIPILTILVEVLHCKDGQLYKVEKIECYSDKHIILITLGMLTIIMIGIGAYIRKDNHDKMMHNIASIYSYKDDQINIDSKYLIYRSIIIILAFMYTIEYSLWQLIIAWCMCIGSFLPYVFFIYYLPHRRNFYNYLKCSLYLCTWGVFLITLYVTHMEIEEIDEKSALLYPILFILGILTTYLRINVRFTIDMF